jgi:hypothetical protein
LALRCETTRCARDLDVEPGFDRCQVLVEAAAQVGEAGVVGRYEGVAKDHDSGRGAVRILASKAWNMTGGAAFDRTSRTLADVTIRPRCAPAYSQPFSRTGCGR